MMKAKVCVMLCLLCLPLLGMAQPITIKKCATCGKPVTNCQYKGSHPKPNPQPVRKCKTCGKAVSACTYKGNHPAPQPVQKCKTCGKAIAACQYKGKHPTASPTPALTGERVSTAEEFLQKLGSDKTIIVPKNTTLTFQDGTQLEGVSNLTIIGEGNSKIQIISRRQTVLVLSKCHDIKILNIALGHVENGEEIGCGYGADVIGIYESRQVEINKCDLWGCGYDGLYAERSYGIKCVDTVIRDCSSSGISLWECASVNFLKCDIIRNAYIANGNICVLGNCQNIVFDDCRFAENSSKPFLFSVNQTDGILKNCEIHHRGRIWDERYGRLEESNCKWYQDYESLPPR